MDINLTLTVTVDTPIPHKKTVINSVLSITSLKTKLMTPRDQWYAHPPQQADQVVTRSISKAREERQGRSEWRIRIKEYTIWITEFVGTGHAWDGIHGNHMRSRATWARSTCSASTSYSRPCQGYMWPRLCRKKAKDPYEPKQPAQRSRMWH